MIPPPVEHDLRPIDHTAENPALVGPPVDDTNDEGGDDRNIDEPRRRLTPRTLDDRLSVFGSGLAALALAWVLFQRLLPTDGAVGFALLWLGTFLLLYAAVTAIRHPGTVIADRLAAAVVHAGAVTVGATLCLVIVYTVWRGCRRCGT